MNDRAVSSPADIAPRTGAKLRPRDSSTLVVYEKRGGDWCVFMGVRSSKHAFFPDTLAFPGGAVDPTDWAVPLAGGLSAEAERLLRIRPRRKMSERRTVAIAAAALREAYEEAGILIGGPVPPRGRPPRDWQGFFAHGLAPDLSHLVMIMRAITPPGRPRRFDNRFFAVDSSRVALDLPPEQCPTDELVDRRFLPIDEALEHKLPRVTRFSLIELKERLTIPGGMSERRPIPFYRPVEGDLYPDMLG